VGKGKPGRALVVEVGQRPALQLFFRRSGRVEPGVALPHEFPRRLGDGLARGSLTGSLPGGQGKGKISKVGEVEPTGGLPTKGEPDAHRVDGDALIERRHRR
jgi:hypothetical protein